MPILRGYKNAPVDFNVQKHVLFDTLDACTKNLGRFLAVKGRNEGGDGSQEPGAHEAVCIVKYSVMCIPAIATARFMRQNGQLQ